MIDTHNGPWAVTILRLALGVMFIAHSLLLKYAQLTLPGTAEIFVSLGLTPGLAYVVFAAELFGGIMLILGIQARWVALLLAPILVGATWAHWDNGWLFLNEGGGWEYPAYLFVLCIAQALLGDGRLALTTSRIPSIRQLRGAATGVT